MFFDHIRPIHPIRALVTLVLGTAFMSLLFLPEPVANQNRVALDWRPEIEVLLLVGVVAVFTALGRRMPAWLRWSAASLLTLGALLHAIAAVVPSFFERELDLYWDLPHVPSVVGLSVVLLPIPWPTVGSLASAGLSGEVGHQIGNAWFSFRVLNGGAGPYGEALASPEPPV